AALRKGGGDKALSRPRPTSRGTEELARFPRRYPLPRGIACRRAGRRFRAGALTGRGGYQLLPARCFGIATSFQRTGISVTVGWTDPYQQLPSQPTRSGGRTEDAAFERLESRVAKDHADRVAAQPPRLGRRLISARRTYRDGTQLVRAAKVGLECCQYCAERRWVDTVSRPLDLDALEPMADFIHLEKYHHRHAADRLVG